MNNHRPFFLKCKVFRCLALFYLLTHTLLTFAYDFEVDGIYYNKISNNEVEVTFKSTSDRGYYGEITIPNSIQYGGNIYNVISIGASAFYDCSEVTGSLTIPNSVTSIGNYAFYHCSGLTGSLTIPNSVTSIGNYAFNGCSGFTGSLTIPNSVAFIGEAAFTNCTELSGSLTIPSSITSISKYCFAACWKLTGPLVIPNSVTLIEEHAFSGCRGLTGTLSIPYSVTSIGQGAFQSCKGLTGLTIPNSVISIGSSAFLDCTNIIIVKSEIEEPFSIDTDVFWLNSSKHKTLQVPKGTKSKYTALTGWTTYFNEVTEYEGNTVTKYTLSITATGNGSASYNSTSIRNKTQSFTVYEGTNAIISFTPDIGYRIASVKVNNTDVTSSVSNDKYTISNISKDTSVEIVFGIFEVNGLTYKVSTTSATAQVTGKISSYSGDIVIPETISDQGVVYTVTSIGEEAFYHNNDITSVVIPKTITLIDDDAFHQCNINTVYISSLESWLNIAFGDSGSNPLCGASHLFIDGEETTDIIIPDGRTILDDYVFIGFLGLQKLTLPNSIKALYQEFSGCSNLQLVISKIVDPSKVGLDSDSYPFKGISPNAILQVPKGTRTAYLVIPKWANYFKEITEPLDNFSLAITVSGNGSASYNSTTIRNKTQSFTVNEGTNATVSFTPDTGYRIASVKLNSTDVTSSVSNNKYTISNITTNTTLSVTFEAIPPTTYSLSITASGNGSASYNSSTIRNSTQSFTVNEGTNATVSFTPDAGYRIKNVKLNNTDVTSSVSSNKYTISNITGNTTLTVTFEAIPPTTYSLSITSSGNGIVSYNNATARNNTQSFTVNEGTNATVTFSPDTGYRVASVKLNNTDVTSNVSNNTYTIGNITQNTTLAVTFEAIPVTTYSLNITASGNGSVTYSGTTIEKQTQSFTVNEGASAMLTFNPDNGYRVGSVKVNNTDVTSGVVNNRYTISNITANTTVSVAFEAIPETTYSLSITASGNGSVTYNGTTIKNQTQTFTVNEGAYATLALSAESGYRIASVRVNGSDDTYSVTNNQYTISYISQNTTVEVTFETIPIPTYSLSITATGNGSAAFNGTTVKNQTRSFTLDEGTTATVTFSPDNGNSVSSVKVNGNDVTSQISANRYTINNITANTTLEVTFQEDVNALTVDGLNYTVTSQSDKTVMFTGGNFGLVLTVPATITQNGTTWKVTGIDNNALRDNTELAAIIWNPEAAFTATVSNPNLLLYVKSAQYAPSTIKNVVVNGTANSITLTDAASGNNFYCPEAFTAQKISYIHHYSMMTGIGESKGWETIALPFDVQKIEHASKGTIVPFTQWRSGDTTKPFWLYELKSNGFAEASSIKANTPYIISMPNNPQYADQYQLVGNVTLSAENVTVSKSDNLQQPKYNDRTFVPNFQIVESDRGMYALNVNNDYVTNDTGMTEGSKFVMNMRKVHPFEAYMTTSSTNAPEFFDVFEGMTTDISEQKLMSTAGNESVYDLQGRRIIKNHLTKGIYIVNGQKIIIK